ncbi:MAG: nucleoside 2-deoxyribosyltransferase [Verrucomicrobia bacterium]|nr:nucleoside 2-deoxyribosyltransferase [Verrucomicrobiota bacterium]
MHSSLSALAKLQKIDNLITSKQAVGYLMKYYIATSLSRVTAHHIVREALKTCGHEISYDWTSHGSVKSTSKERLQEVATLELEGIADADFVVVLLPGGGGTHLELGFAIAKGKKVFLHSEEPSLFELGPQTNAFYHHPDIIQLVCPLAEVGRTVHSLLALPAMVP